jgi:uncharacterized protein (TIGR03382 family)
MLSLAAVCQHCSAAIITRWDFNSNPPDGNVTTGAVLNMPAVGAGSVNVIGGVTFTYQAGSSADPAASDNSSVSTANYPAATSGNKSAGLEVAVSTAGFSGIIVSYDQENTTKASKYWTFQYSTDGTSFTDFAAPYAVATAGGFSGNVTTYRFNLSSIPAVNNDPNLKFRIVSTFDPASGTSYSPTGTGTTYSGLTGSALFDYLTVESSPTPEPASLAFAGFAGALLLHRRR